MKNLQQILSDDLTLLQAVVCNDEASKEMLIQDFLNQKRTKDKRLLKYGIALELEMTISKNLQFYQVTASQIRQLQEMLPKLNFEQKVKHCSEYEAGIVLLYCGIGSKTCFLDYDLQNLDETAIENLLDIAKKLQQVYQVNYVFMTKDAVLGRYFESVCMYHNSFFFPLKMKNEKEYNNVISI